MASLQIALLYLTATPAAPTVPELPSQNVEAARPARVEAASEDASGLRNVAFVRNNSTARHVPPDLRDPFGPDAQRHGASDGSTPSDLRDPFHVRARRPNPSGTRDGDLRDPFGKNRKPPPQCPEATSDGVVLQRPEAVKKDRCERAAQDRFSATYLAVRE